MNSVALKKVVRLALMEKIDPNRLQALIIKSTLNNQEEHLRKTQFIRYTCAQYMPFS